MSPRHLQIRMWVDMNVVIALILTVLIFTLVLWGTLHIFNLIDYIDMVRVCEDRGYEGALYYIDGEHCCAKITKEFIPFTEIDK